MSEQESNLAGYIDYMEANFAVEDAVLQNVRETLAADGLPQINVSRVGGKTLYMLAKISRAERILEVGTLGGYSAIWLARALPANGKLITLELDPHHAEVAQKNIDLAGLGSKVEIRVGAAAETLTAMAGEGLPPFDMAFIDADKDGYAGYLAQVVPLVRDGGLILGDNTLPDTVLSADGDSGTKRYNTAVAAHPHLVSTIIPVLRQSGVDGLTVSIKGNV